ncbi:MAG: hypothetical protein U0K91_02360 [Acutalibacteraceae bacterium]|nr:hypothetical protein [Acutalibacteraceae bacterium]
MNRFTEIYIELVAAGYSYEEAEKLAKTKYEEEMAILNRIELKVNRVMLMLKQDFRYHKVFARIDTMRTSNNAFTFEILYSHRPRPFALTYNLTYEAIDKILNGDLSAYYEMTAFFYGTILKMKHEED